VTVRLPKAGVPVGRPVAPPPGQPKPAPAAPPSPSGSGNAGLLIGLGVVGFLLLAGAAVVIVIALAPGKGKKDALAGANPAGSARAEERPTRPDDGAAGTEKGGKPPQRDPLDPPPPPTSLTEEEQREVNKSIDRGAEYLKKHLPPDAMAGQSYYGTYPLIGLTLLECGVAADDPIVVRIAKAVRDEAPRMTHTYGLSLSILFLDRLGEAEDDKVIRLLAARLVAGQTVGGGWTYTCPVLSEPDSQLLLTYLDTNPLPGLSALRPANSGAPLVVRSRDKSDDPSRTAPGDAGGLGRAGQPLTRADLPASVKDQPAVTYEPETKLQLSRQDDNSNTQFGILGVWAARRHGVAVDRSVAMISARFRQTQNADGSWGYYVHTEAKPDSMTCAGLLGLAVARAGDGAAGAAEQDPAIARGLQFLGRKVRDPGGVRPRQGGQPSRRLVGADALGDLYWLWSVERVGMIYGLPTIGGKDWYAWGAGLLVANQGDDGSWSYGYVAHVDTCFALLFLKRANVAKDLTHQLQRIGPTRDPDLMRDGK
jgi:hypothetical protein